MKMRELNLKADKYIKKHEPKFHVTTTKRVLTLLFTSPLEDSLREPIVTEFYCQSRVGTLINAATCSATRHTICVNFVSQSKHTQNKAMVKTVDMSLSCLARTMSVCLTSEGPNPDLIRKGHNNAPFGANAKNEDKRSSYRWMLVIDGYATCGIAKRHSTTSLSMAEAEVLAMKEVIAQATHMHPLIDVETP